MADKKFLPGFGYDPRRYNLTEVQRQNLQQEFGLLFSVADFADMEHALNACHGAYEALQKAPTPSNMQAHLDSIRNAARALWVALHPEQIEIGFDKTDRMFTRSPQEYEGAREAADRVKFRFINRDDDGNIVDGPMVAQFNEFDAVLSHLPIVAEDVKARLLKHMVVSDRATRHLDYLLTDLVPIARRHNQNERVSRPVTEYAGADPAPTSFIAKLAYRLSENLDIGWEDMDGKAAAQLPPEMKRKKGKQWQKAVGRPKSETALAHRLASLVPPDRRRRPKKL